MTEEQKKWLEALTQEVKKIADELDRPVVIYSHGYYLTNLISTLARNVSR